MNQTIVAEELPSLIDDLKHLPLLCLAGDVDHHFAPDERRPVSPK